MYVQRPSINLYKLTCKPHTGCPLEVSITNVEIGGLLDAAAVEVLTLK